MDEKSSGFSLPLTLQSPDSASHWLNPDRSQGAQEIEFRGSTLRAPHEADQREEEQRRPESRPASGWHVPLIPLQPQ